MKVKIKELIINNFKGIKNLDIKFSEKTFILGNNGSGKSTIIDAVLWCLFGTDSNWNTKFEVRPLDKQGNKIHNIAISVIVIFDIDKKEISFHKIANEKVVIKRGTQEEVIQGNIYSYFVNEYPQTEKDYKENISNIIDEKLFKVLISPTCFPNRKWQEQREILLQLVNGVSDVELARNTDKFKELIPELEKASSINDIKNKYQKKLCEYKKKQNDLPIRIDEVKKQKTDIDIDNLEFLKGSLNEKIIENKVKQEDISKEFEEQQKENDSILELKFELNNLQRKANEENNKKRNDIENFILVDETSKLNLERKIKELEEAVSFGLRVIDRDDSLDKCRKEYAEAYNRNFDENSFVCQYCGQEYPEDKKEKLRAEFDTHRAEELKRIIEKGNALKERRENAKREHEKNEEELKNAKLELDGIEKLISDRKKQLSEIPDSIDISDRPEVQEIQRQIAEKEQAMNKSNSAEKIRQHLKSAGEELQKQMDAVNEQFVYAKKNIEADNRIAELQAEQREVAQKVADQEKMIDLLEEFISFKMDRVSDTINEKLDGICVKLFENQINGGVKECCELTYDGVSYGSLNSGHRIVAGLKIIKALQNFYGVYAPIFVDNAESINDFNLPEMDCQTILLFVPRLTHW